MKHLFVIDDTGSPGSKQESLMLKSDRVTYVAVMISSDIREELARAIGDLIEKHGVKEFHFTDILNRRKSFKNLSTDEVLLLFKEFVNLLNHYKLPYFVQTITPRTLAENGMNNNFNKSLDEIALDFLMARIKNFIEENSIEFDFEMVIDEGLGKPGSKLEIPWFKDITSENYLHFHSSTTNILLQIADFFAFTMNRNQLIAIKDARTEFDLILLTMLNTVFQGNPSSGSEAVMYSHSTHSKEDYDNYQIQKFKEFGVYEYWKKVVSKANSTGSERSAK